LAAGLLWRNPITTEILGVARFDWLLLDAEHAPNDVLTLIPQLMALKDSPTLSEPVNSSVTLCVMAVQTG
jgi:2-dehydro-3-deoxyglucarate aldolase